MTKTMNAQRILTGYGQILGEHSALWHFLWHHPRNLLEPNDPTKSNQRLDGHEIKHVEDAKFPSSEVLVLR
jgi:hypothetical protein